MERENIDLCVGYSPKMREIKPLITSINIIIVIKKSGGEIS